MNPVVIIPTYWSGRRVEGGELLAAYDHMTPIDSDGELPRCLDSLRGVRGIGRIVLLVVAEPAVEHQAAAKVRETAASYEELDIVVIGVAEIGSLHRRLEQLSLSDLIDGVSLRGYGSVRNVGLLVASVLGHDVVIFIDDDEVVTDADFLERAVYGLGQKTKRGVPVLAKTGYYLDRAGSWEASSKKHWYNCLWKQNELFNEWIRKAMKGPRISRANSVCGGCMVLHAEAYSRVAFDPWITRGEDLDYMLNMRMYGLDVWFDNRWRLRHLPPETTSESLRFRQDIYRWIYEHRKIEYGRTQIDLLQVKPKSLKPYPGPFLEAAVVTRIFVTALFRSIARPERQGYLKAALHARGDASKYARKNCASYFEFQYRWPELVRRLWKDVALGSLFRGERQMDRSTLTGQFPVIPTRDERGEGSDDPFSPRERR